MRGLKKQLDKVAGALDTATDKVASRLNVGSGSIGSASSSVYSGGGSSANMGDFVQGNLSIIVHDARNLPNMDSTSLTDAYVRVTVDGRKGPRTRTVNDNLNPSFEEELSMALAGKTSQVTLHVKDEDLAGVSEEIGTVVIPMPQIQANQVINRVFPILHKGKQRGELRISLVFQDAAVLAETTEVGESYFAERFQCKVTLYQDAHIEANSALPKLSTLPGFNYDQNKCAWKDIYCAIRDAKHFIYITGWSVWTEVTLLREQALGPEGVSVTLGNLLKSKASQGVKVLMLVWDELLSVDNPVLHKVMSTSRTGLMNTHDEETRKFFEGSPVVCQLVTRKGEGIDTSSAGNVSRISQALGSLGAKALFTHHQKSVICDAPSKVGDRRRIIAFVGGLDLTNGRFDTPSHPLFSTLQTWHRNDYYQAYENFSQDYGPREPWHDIHCRLEGPIARDVMRNFELRWRRQASKKVHELVDLTRLPILPELQDIIADNLSWNCQLFRSIDHYSAEFPPNAQTVGNQSHPHMAMFKNLLHSSSSGQIDRSIYNAYLHYIRRAKRFIYIENQYFLGSSQEWQGFDEKKWNVECKHRIPFEIAMKIVSKIRKREPFAVYVVIPMHPEGPGPEKPAVQAILYWQYKTIEMMYAKIQEALTEIGSPGSPTDFLNFYFLGQREAGAPPAMPPTVDQRQVRMCGSRRSMIYVHSKMMIIDDEYIIVGSANINERSMAGDRDTEIAVGMYQLAHTTDKNEFRRSPTGDVAAFRLSLWGEHMGILEPIFLTPNTVDCVRRVNQIALYNWAIFEGTAQQPMPGHLCKYPYVVSSAGIQFARKCFPDMEPGGLVCGEPQNAIPNILTT